MEFVEIGKLRKPHGLKGELKLLITERFEDNLAENVDAFFVEQAGRMMPYFIEYLRGKGAFILKLEDIDSKEDANLIANRPIFLRRKDILMTDEELAADDSGLEYNFLTNYTLETELLGTVGTILSVEDFPQQEMAVVRYEGKDFLIPLLKEWILNIDKETKIVRMELPEGLLDLA